MGNCTPSNDELRRILDAATDGPWTAESWMSEWFDIENGHVTIASELCREDARLIALAPALTAEVIRLREGIEALADLADHCQDIAAETVLRECRALLDGGAR